MATIERGSWPINWQRRGSKFDAKSAPIAGRSGHDQTAIVSHDRGSNVTVAVRSGQVSWAITMARSTCSFIFRPMEMDASRSFHASPR